MNIKRKQSKKAHVRVSHPKMAVAASSKERLVLSFTEEQKTLVKVSAVLRNKTVSDYLLDLVKQDIKHKLCDFPGCDGVHIPNEETAKVLRETDAGLNLESHKSLNDFWKSMGMKPNANKPKISRNR
jgi:hypothetical protein